MTLILALKARPQTSFLVLAALLFGLTSTQASAFDWPEADEAALSDHYSELGRGRDRHDPSVDIGTQSSNRAALKLFSKANRSVRKSKRLFRQHIRPLLVQHFPEVVIQHKKRVEPKGAHQNMLAQSKPESAEQIFAKKILKETVRNVFFAEMTAAMHGSPIPDEALIFFAASHPIYDAIFDVDQKDSPYTRRQMVERVTRVIHRDYNLSPPVLSVEKLVIEIVKGLERSLPPQNVERFFKELSLLNQAQIYSGLQQAKKVDLESLRDATLKKGGYSMRLYALLADHDFTEEEMGIYFLEGAFLQSLDDMSDFAEDERDGTVTLAASHLITPRELVRMTDVWYGMLDNLVADGSYDAEGVANYKLVIDAFIDQATAKYEKSTKERQAKATSAGKRVALGARDAGLFVVTLPFRVALIPVVAAAWAAFPAFMFLD